MKLKLEELARAGKKRKRIGRGGDRGGTSGRGHKGQKARTSPNIPAQFEGGQMPLTRRLPKRGFNNASFKTEYEIISLKELHNAFDEGQTVTRELLTQKGLLKTAKRSKLLANGTLDKKLTVQVNACSKAAAAAITQAGGEIQITKEK